MVLEESLVPELYGARATVEHRQCTSQCGGVNRVAANVLDDEGVPVSSPARFAQRAGEPTGNPDPAPAAEPKLKPVTVPPSPRAAAQLVAKFGLLPLWRLAALLKSRPAAWRLPKGADVNNLALLHQAVCAHPSKDVPRLEYPDALDEQAALARRQMYVRFLFDDDLHGGGGLFHKGSPRPLTTRSSRRQRGHLHESERGDDDGRGHARLRLSVPDNTHERLCLHELINGEDVVAFRLRGDSMADDAIQPGDYVIVRRGVEALDGQTVVARFDDELFLKVYRRTRGTVYLHSRNADMPATKFVPGPDSALIGVLIGVVCRY
ncbi:MAG: hypothetical protein FJ304_26410 [Planctomycetes bacterium]|nr:hypothetical protein [Planctomycetota bacterium]